MPDSVSGAAPTPLLVETEFEELIGRYQKRLYNLAYRYLGSPEEAEDITQETFLRAYKKRDSFRGESSIGTWLTRIAVNLSIDALRKRKTRPLLPWPRARAGPGDGEQELEFPDEEQNLEEEAQNRDLRNTIYDAMDRLSPQQRMVFILKHLQDLSLQEIAEITGLSQGTIKSQLFRGVRKIRRELEGGK